MLSSLLSLHGIALALLAYPARPPAARLPALPWPAVIIADVLVGSPPQYGGMLPAMLGRHDNPWWLARPTALLAGVVLPALVPRTLKAVAKLSSFSVCMLFLLASAISSLAVVAVARGQVAPGVRLLPDAATMGDTPLGILTSVLTVVSGEKGWPGPRGSSSKAAAGRRETVPAAPVLRACAAATSANSPPPTTALRYPPNSPQPSHPPTCLCLQSAPWPAHASSTCCPSSARFGTAASPA